MKRFIITVAVFGIILFSIDLVLHKFLAVIRPPDYKVFIDSKKEILSSDSPDILILGDCVVSDAIDTRILEEKTRLKSFNLGVYLSSPIEHYYLLKNVLKKLDSSPPILLLGTSPFIFSYMLQEGQYTPVIMDDFLLKSELILKSDDKNYLGIFFNSVHEKDLFRYFINHKVFKKDYSPQREIVESCNGYLEFYDHSIKDKGEYCSDDIWLPTNNIKNNEQVKYYIKIIELAKKENMEIVLVNVPELPVWEKFYTNQKEYIEYKKTIMDIIQKYNLKYYKYDKTDLESKDFMNEQHMNSNGAKKYSQDLSNWLDSLEIFNEIKRNQLTQKLN